MKLLDLFCCAGGAGKGYRDSGFHVTGVDINPQPRYAGDKFIQGDALEYLATYGREYDVIHASPPCQASSALTKGTNKGRLYPNLIPATRELLAQFETPTIIENVQGSDLRRDLTLCGEIFNLGVIRHRYFEVTGVKVSQPVHQKHRGRVAGWRHGQWFDGPYFAVYGDGGGQGHRRPVAAGDGYRLDRRPQGNRRSYPAGIHATYRLSGDLAASRVDRKSPMTDHVDDLIDQSLARGPNPRDYLHPCRCGHWSWHGLPVKDRDTEEWCPGSHIKGQR